MAKVFHSQSSHFYNDIAKVQNKNETAKFQPFIRSQISHDFRTNFLIIRVSPNGRSYGRSMGGLTGGLRGGLKNVKSLIQNQLTKKNGRSCEKPQNSYVFGLQTISFSSLNISFTTYITGICCMISP